jgi:perosamine synthetase
MRGQTKQFWADIVGYKYKMSNIQAAIGLAQIERVDALTLRKREIFAIYRSKLSSVPGISLNPERQGTVNGAWMPTVVFDKSTGVTRERLQSVFALADIDARVFFHPLSALPMFENQSQNIHAHDIPTRAINLPSYHDMADHDIERVCSVVGSLYQ